MTPERAEVVLSAESRMKATLHLLDAAHRLKLIGRVTWLDARSLLGKGWRIELRRNLLLLEREQLTLSDYFLSLETSD